MYQFISVCGCIKINCEDNTCTVSITDLKPIYNV